MAKRGPKVTPLEERLARLSELDPDTGCFIWIGKIDHGGYGHIKHDGRDQKAATVAYEFYKGPIPEGLEVSHICPSGANPACVNPDHLIAETHAENLARREWQPKGQRYVLNCRHCGQPKELVKNGNRMDWVCKACRASHAKEWREKTGYDFNTYRAQNRERINEQRRARRNRAKEE